MANIQTQISEARKAGYDDADIAAHLSKMPEYGSKMKTAFDAGYQPVEILAYLTSSAKTPVSEIPKARGFAGMAGDVLAGAVRGAGSIGATILAPADYVAGKIAEKYGEIPFLTGRDENRRARMTEGLQTMGADPESTAFALSKTGAEIAGTLPIGGLFGRSVTAVAPRLTPLATALETGGFRTGLPQATTALQRVGDVALRAGGGTIAGGAGAAAVNPEDLETGAAVGAALPTVGAGVVKLFGLGSGWLWDAVSGQLGKVKAGEIARKVAGGDVNAIRAANAAAEQGISSGQAAAGIDNAAYAALDDLARKQNPASYYSRQAAAQETARQQALSAVTPDLAAATTARGAATQPLYQAADKTIVKLDAPFMELFDRMPKGTIAKAADIARMDGRPFMMGQYTPAQQVPTGVLNAAGAPIMTTVPAQFPTVTGESLHYLKRALSDIANAPTAITGAGKDTQAAARGVLADFIPQFEAKVPVYGQARQTFAQMSEPVNQSQVLGEMASVLAKPGGGERAAPFLNVLGRGEQAMLKRATGFPRYSGLPDVLTAPGQMSTVDKIAGELGRDAQLNRLAAQGGEELSNIIRDAASGFNFPHTLSTKVAVARQGLREFEGKINKATLKALAEGMKSGASANAMLDALPAKERSKVLRIMTNSATWRPQLTAGVRQGMVNQLAPQENRNNLAR
jgi:hypothetical protein